MRWLSILLTSELFYFLILHVFPKLWGNGPTFTGGSAMIGTAWLVLATASNTLNWNIILETFWHFSSLLRIPLECLRSGCWRLGLHRPFLRVPSLFSLVATATTAYCPPLSPQGLLLKPSFVSLSILIGFVFPVGTRGSISSKKSRLTCVLESMQKDRVGWK